MRGSIKISESTEEFCVLLAGPPDDTSVEREYLLKNVFPELRQLCRERGIVFREIDLYPGETESRIRQGRIVSTSLREIVRRRPYVFALIGNQCGWCPEADDVNGAESDKELSWLHTSVAEGKSLAELETLEVARHVPGMDTHVRFYFRDRLRKDKHAEANSEEGRLLEEFRSRVEESGLPRRDGYQTPEQLGRWLYQDVLEILERIVPEEPGGDTWLVRERLGHQAYAETRRRAYIDHDPTLRRLDEYVLEGDGTVGDRTLPLVVSGDSGAGKSALLARWSHLFRGRSPGAFVIEHYTGATPSSVDPVAFMRRVMAEIRDRYQLDEDLPILPDQIVAEFPLWLAHVRNETLVLVLDALDRFSDPALAISQFPADYPGQVRIICSGLPGCEDYCSERGWPSFRITPLGEQNRRRAIRAYLAEFSKGLEPEQVRKIASDGKNANPLYLRTSLEELRQHGQSETLNLKIEHYLSAEDPTDLFRLVLERVENEYGKRLTTVVMSLLWASRGGLSDNEIAEIAGVSLGKVDVLVRGMEHHLTNIQGRLNFCHEHMRHSIENRYAFSRTKRRNLHRKIAGWFAGQPVTDRRVEEEPWQWREAEEWGRLEECLTDVPVLVQLLQSGDDISAHQYRLELRELDSVMPNYSVSVVEGAVQRFLKSDTVGADAKVEMLITCLRFWRESADLETAEMCLNQIQAFADRHGQDQHGVMILCEQGLLMQERGRYHVADKYFCDALDILDSRRIDEHRMIADVLDNRASLHYALRNYEQAESMALSALKYREEKEGTKHPKTILSYINMGSMFYGMGRYHDARRYLKKALSLCRKELGEYHQLTANALNNLAATYRGSDEYESAILFLEEALAINKAIFGTQHPDYAANLSNLAYFYNLAQNFLKSEQSYRQNLAIQRTLYGRDHPLVATGLINLGTALLAQGKFEEAEEVYREALSLRILLFGADHISAHTCWLNIAGVFLEKGEEEKALEIFRRSLPVKERVLGRDHPEVLMSYNRLEQHGYTPSEIQD